jgi:hypothetical protein
MHTHTSICAAIAAFAAFSAALPQSGGELNKYLYVYSDNACNSDAAGVYEGVCVYGSQEGGAFRAQGCNMQVSAFLGDNCSGEPDAVFTVDDLICQAKPGFPWKSAFGRCV